MTVKSNKKWGFIINPVAGNGFAKSMAPILKEKIKIHNIAAEVVFTERTGHATDLAKDFLERGFSYIIGVGGDGTLNEISMQLVNKKDVIIGIIPAGTGNDFIQILGFPDRFGNQEWDTFFKGDLISMDAGSCNGMIFINGLGLGFDAQVAAENYTESGKVKKGGKNKYFWHIIKTILFYKEKRMTVKSVNENNETDCFINTIAIGRRFAGGYLLTPRAIANDGLLDVCMIKELSVFERFRLLLKVPEGKHITEKKVNYYQVPAMNIEFSEVVPFHLDGELYFSKDFDVKVLPQALNVIYNPVGNHFFKKQEYGK